MIFWLVWRDLAVDDVTVSEPRSVAKLPRVRHVGPGVTSTDCGDSADRISLRCESAPMLTTAY